MMNKLLPIVLLAVLANLGGCTTFVDATTSKPIEASSEKRTFGTYIDDQRLEVIVAVNIRKADPFLKK